MFLTITSSNLTFDVLQHFVKAISEGFTLIRTSWLAVASVSAVMPTIAVSMLSALLVIALCRMVVNWL